MEKREKKRIGGERIKRGRGRERLRVSECEEDSERERACDGVKHEECVIMDSDDQYTLVLFVV